MATFVDIYSEVIGSIPNIPPPLAQKYVNRAFAKICDLRRWSWLTATGDLLVPEKIDAGKVAVTTGSDTVVLSPEALAAITPHALSTPPVASPILGVGRQFRIFGSSLSSPVYSIVAFDSGASTLTLDRVYTGTTAAETAYQIYRCYYAPPADSSEFLQFTSIVNMEAGYSITGKRLHVSREFLDRIDPKRATSGYAYQLANYKTDANSAPVFELYPHPVQLSVYNTVYQRRYIPLTTSADLPSTLPESLVLSRALVLAGNWAMSNINQYPELAQVNWVQYVANQMAEFKTELIQAIKQDDEIQPILPFTMTHRRNFPLGGEYLQSHDVSSLFSGNQ